MSLPPSEVPQGAIRFNTDSQRLEFYAQGEWWVMSTDTPNLGSASESTDGSLTGGNHTTPGARGVFQGGQNPSGVAKVDMSMINIASAGNSQDFGDLHQIVRFHAGCSSKVRGFSSGGLASSPSVTEKNAIRMFIFASTGSAVDHSNLATSTRSHGSCSNETRGIAAGGALPAVTNVIQYWTMASDGNANDFGDLTVSRFANSMISNSTRGISCGGRTPSSVNTMDFIKIATLGNAQDFGDLQQPLGYPSTGGNSVRGIIAGGTTGSPSLNAGAVNQIEYLTISTTGNSVNFGDLTAVNIGGAGVSSPTRFCRGAGAGSSYQTSIEYIEIATEGNAVDFGDIPNNRGYIAACSNAHGGL